MTTVPYDRWPWAAPFGSQVPCAGPSGGGGGPPWGLLGGLETGPVGPRCLRAGGFAYRFLRLRRAWRSRACVWRASTCWKGAGGGTTRPPGRGCRHSWGPVGAPETAPVGPRCPWAGGFAAQVACSGVPERVPMGPNSIAPTLPHLLLLYLLPAPSHQHPLLPCRPFRVPIESFVSRPPMQEPFCSCFCSPLLLLLSPLSPAPLAPPHPFALHRDPLGVSVAI